jgi:hypothetical protein
LRLPLLALAGAAVALSGCLGGGPSGTKAGPVTIAGQEAKLLDATPCVWDGDSGCDSRYVGTDRRYWVCLPAARTLVLDAGGNAGDVEAKVLRREDAAPAIRLAVRRQTARRFTIDLPRSLRSGMRFMYVAVHYRGGVITPYEPAGDMLSGSDPEQFKGGTYGVRIRLRGC